MDFTISMEFAGATVIVVAALVYGVIVQYIGEVGTGFEWLIDAIAFGVGAIVASEFVTGWRAFEPVFAGVAVLPALLGGLVLGIGVWLVTRYVTGGRFTSGPITA